MYEILAIVVFAATTPQREHQLSHNFSVEQVECSAGIPFLPAERDAVSSQWLPNGELQITFWDSEGADELVDVGWSQATLQGHTITVAYRFTPITREPGMPIIGCSIPVRLHYRLHGLNQRPYKLRIQITSSSARGEIGG